MKLNIKKYVIVFIILLLIFNLLLLLSSLFPSSWIENKVIESSQILNKEGNLYKFRLVDVKNNNYTDSLMINECYSIDNTDPFFSYMSCRKNYKNGITKKQETDIQGELYSISNDYKDEEYNPVKELSLFLNGKVGISFEYARYWHGYLPFLRVLLIFFNINGIRKILLVLFILLFIKLFCLLKKKFGGNIALIFVFSLLGVDYFYVSYSLESAPIFITMMLSSIILLKRIDKINEFYLYMFIVGCISNFVDYLTVPLITLAMPLLIYILHKMQTENKSTKEYLKIILFSCITWGIGYAITWGSKWIIYDILFKKNLINSAISQVLYRSSIKSESSNHLIYYVILNYLIKTINLFYCFGMILLIIKIVRKDFNKREYNLKHLLKKCIPFIIIGMFPIIWYFVLSNHTRVHPHFTYRHTFIILVCLLLCFNIFINNAEKIDKKI